LNWNFYGILVLLLRQPITTTAIIDDLHLETSDFININRCEKTQLTLGALGSDKKR